MVFTDFKNKLANLVFLKKTVSMPTSFYIGFSTTAPKEDGSGITEPAAATGYSKKQLSLSGPIDGVVTNNVAIDYGEAKANWGTVTHLVIYDQDQTPLFANRLEAPIMIEAGDLARIKVGNVSLFFAEAAASV